MGHYIPSANFIESACSSPNDQHSARVEEEHELNDRPLERERHGNRASVTSSYRESGANVYVALSILENAGHIKNDRSQHVDIPDRWISFADTPTVPTAFRLAYLKWRPVFAPSNIQLDGFMTVIFMTVGRLYATDGIVLPDSRCFKVRNII